MFSILILTKHLSHIVAVTFILFCSLGASGLSCSMWDLCCSTGPLAVGSEFATSGLSNCGEQVLAQ